MLAECVQGLVRDGLLTSAEQRRATSPAYYRSLAEFTAPLDDPNSAVSKAGLVLASAEVRHFACPLRAELVAQRAAAAPVDAAAYARTFVEMLRCVTSWEVVRAFGSGSGDEARPADERQRLVDRVYADFAARVEARPDDFSFDFVLCHMVIEKS